MIKRIYILKSTLSLLFAFALNVAHCQQNDSAALAAADTTNFSPNAENSWEIYNSYVAMQTTDSVIVQVILRHDNDITWTDDQYIGKIKGDSLLPAAESIGSFMLADASYQFRIESTGECYLKLISGDPPSANPAVLPFTVIYRK